jgi:hypothetical protein
MSDQSSGVGNGAPYADEIEFLNNFCYVAAPLRF